MVSEKIVDLTGLTKEEEMQVRKLEQDSEKLAMNLSKLLCKNYPDPNPSVMALALIKLLAYHVAHNADNSTDLAAGQGYCMVAFMNESQQFFQEQVEELEEDREYLNQTPKEDMI